MSVYLSRVTPDSDAKTKINDKFRKAKKCTVTGYIPAAAAVDSANVTSVIRDDAGSTAGLTFKKGDIIVGGALWSTAALTIASSAHVTIGISGAATTIVTAKGLTAIATAFTGTPLFTATGTVYVLTADTTLWYNLVSSGVITSPNIRVAVDYITIQDDI